MFKDPIIFEPFPMERIWGGRRLESVLGKTLPPGSSIGESWEIVDREDTQSVVHEGDLRGATLHDLWTRYRVEIFGNDYARHPAPRFPIIIKLIDARERLSLQVHPPAKVAEDLHGEPKTEMWYFLDCLPGAFIYAGLKKGVSKEDFQKALKEHHVEQTVHSLPVCAGESIVVPSGRIHALGEGCLLVEVQQNSDTTYRVFDWDRIGFNGDRRPLHLTESLSSIDFQDYEPTLNLPQGEQLSDCEYFVVEKWTIENSREASSSGVFAIFGVMEGAVACGNRVFERGEFFLQAASSSQWELKAVANTATVLRVTLPS